MSTVERKPLYFGPDARRLFGWYHAPAGESALDLAVVICPPIGHEYINSHRTVRRLADALASRGVAALRFDYDGTGDSAGRDEDPGRVNAWTRSIRDAMTALRGLTSARDIGLVGIRMGATLAARVAHDTDVPCLMLWAPLVRGREYAREMKAMHLTGTRTGPTDPGTIEPGGFVMTEETQREISALNLEELTPRSPSVLIATRDDLAEDTRLREKWTAAGLSVEQRALPGYADMFTAPHAALVPEVAIDTIAVWAASRASRAPRNTSTPTTVTAEIDGVRESVFLNEGVFGIVSEPLEILSPAKPSIVLSNAGSAHHTGPNRLYVMLARRLAREGFRTLRFDMPGLGDSFVDDIAKENEPYLPEASAVLSRVIAALAARSIVLAGLCSGAHASFHASLDLAEAPVDECILINPLTFYYAKGMSLDAPPDAQFREWNWYMRSMRSVKRWGKLLRGQVQVRKIIRAVFNRVRHMAASQATSVRKRIRRETPAGPAALESDLRAIISSGKRLTFVFARYASGYDLLMTHAGGFIKRYRKRRMVDLWFIDNANHTFEAKHARNAMIESVTQHLVKRYGA